MSIQLRRTRRISGRLYPHVTQSPASVPSPATAPSFYERCSACGHLVFVHSEHHDENARIDRRFASPRGTCFYAGCACTHDFGVWSGW